MTSHRKYIIPLLLAGAASVVAVSTSGTFGLDTLRDREITEGPRAESRADDWLEDMIRASLAEDPALSESAKKVKVATNRGSVILRGSVASEAEKARVVDIAKRASPTGLIEDDLEIIPQ